MLILLSGKSFTGKDTLCKALIEKYPELQRVSIADTMKIEFMKQYPEIDMFDRIQKEAHRLELKEYTHQFPFSYWLERAPYCENCVCTDIRTTDEIDFIKNKFPNSVIVVVRVHASSEIRAQRGWVFKEGYDDSYLETMLDTYPFDLIVHNETKKDLETSRDRILSSCYFKDIGYGFRITRQLFNGVSFTNAANLYSDPILRDEHTLALCKLLSGVKITHILALESGGYMLGMMLAIQLKIPFVVIRKPGKLPPPVYKVNYSMEYRPDNEMEIQTDSFNSESRVLVVDDIIVTGGTMYGAQMLVHKFNATVVGFACLAIMESTQPLRIDPNKIYTSYIIRGGQCIKK